jgi:hypothetical protein
MMAKTGHLMDCLAGQLADTEAGWSVATFCAIAEFTRDTGELAELNQTSDMLSVVTGRSVSADPATRRQKPRRAAHPRPAETARARPHPRREPSRRPKAGFPVRISIPRIRWATSSAESARFDEGIMPLFRP